jgi:hypothetical protein
LVFGFTDAHMGVYVSMPSETQVWATPSITVTSSLLPRRTMITLLVFGFTVNGPLPPVGRRVVASVAGSITNWDESPPWLT